jgi:hypothetical protein
MPIDAGREGSKRENVVATATRIPASSPSSRPTPRRTSVYESANPSQDSRVSANDANATRALRRPASPRRIPAAASSVRAREKPGRLASGRSKKLSGRLP